MAGDETRTWRELLPTYLPDPHLITRADLLADLADAGISERTLRYWESIGALPRAVRQVHGGMVRAIYPHWFARVVRAVRERQQRGETLEEIARTVPESLAFFALFAWAEEHRTFPLDLYAPQLLPPLRDLAEAVSREGLGTVAAGAITLYDAQGVLIRTLPWFADAPQLSDAAALPPPTDS